MSTPAKPAKLAPHEILPCSRPPLDGRACIHPDGDGHAGLCTFPASRGVAVHEEQERRIKLRAERVAYQAAKDTGAEPAPAAVAPAPAPAPAPAESTPTPSRAPTPPTTPGKGGRRG